MDSDFKRAHLEHFLIDSWGFKIVTCCEYFMGGSAQVENQWQERKVLCNFKKKLSSTLKGVSIYLYLPCLIVCVYLGKHCNTQNVMILFRKCI